MPKPRYADQFAEKTIGNFEVCFRSYHGSGSGPTVTLKLRHANRRTPTEHDREPFMELSAEDVSDLEYVLAFCKRQTEEAKTGS